MSRPFYGSSLDVQILQLFAAGAVYADMAAVLGVSRYFLAGRADALGIRRKLAIRSRAAGWAKRKQRVAPPIVHRSAPDRLRRLDLAGRSDDSASRIVRLLRSHRPAHALACIDPDNVGACAFARGLTLPEIHEAFGVPPREAVAAIRAHHGSLAA